MRGSEELLYAAESTLLVGLLGALAVHALVRRLAASRPGLRIGRALLVGGGLRLAVAAVLSASASLSDLHGPDDALFSQRSELLSHLPLGDGEWLTAVTHELHTALFALERTVLGLTADFPLRVTQIGLALAGLALVAAAAYDLGGPGAARLTAWIAAFEPANVFFSGLLHKESLIMVGVGLVTLGAARMWLRRDLAAATLIAAGVLVAAGVRLYAAAALAAGAGLVTLHACLRPVGRRAERAPRAAVALALAGLVALGVAGTSQRIYDTLQRSQTANVVDDANLRLEPVDFSSPGGVIAGLPRRIRDVALRPWPWQLENRRQKVGVVGTLAAWLLIAAAVVLAVRRREVLERFGLPLLYLAVAVLVGYALSTGNAGTGFRYRTHVLMLLAALCAVLWNREEPGWRDRS